MNSILFWRKEQRPLRLPLEGKLSAIRLTGEAAVYNLFTIYLLSVYILSINNPFLFHKMNSLKAKARVQ